GLAIASATPAPPAPVGEAPRAEGPLAQRAEQRLSGPGVVDAGAPFQMIARYASATAPAAVGERIGARSDWTGTGGGCPVGGASRGVSPGPEVSGELPIARARVVREADEAPDVGAPEPVLVARAVRVEVPGSAERARGGAAEEGGPGSSDL